MGRVIVIFMFLIRHQHRLLNGRTRRLMRRSAVGTLRLAKKDEHRQRMLDVIEHDVQRLDRLVSDIYNAPRLYSELVKEEEERCNLIKLLAHLT